MQVCVLCNVTLKHCERQNPTMLGEGFGGGPKQVPELAQTRNKNKTFEIKYQIPRYLESKRK